MGTKAAEHAGQKRISFILQRATRKFHGDVGLWMQYLEYSRKQKSYKKVAQVLTSVLRLHPTKPDLWIYAAQYVMEDQGDMTGARSYMQRGLRFCKQSRELWLEYARLELIYISKITRRRRILGINSSRSQQDTGTAVDGSSAPDLIALPAITLEDIGPGLHSDTVVDHDVLQALDSTPALSGAIPIAIFDAAMGNFNDTRFGERFFNVLVGFSTISSLDKMSKHIADALILLDPTSPASISCDIRQPLIGIQPGSSEFPVVLGSVLKKMRIKLEAQTSLALYEKSVAWLLEYLDISDLDPDIRTAIVATVGRIMGLYKILIQRHGEVSAHRLAQVLEQFQVRGLEAVLYPL